MSTRDNDHEPLPLRRFAQVHTRDIDEAEAAGSKVFSAHRLRSTGIDATINTFEVGSTRLIYMQYRADVAVESCDPLGYYSVHLPLRGRGRVTFREEDVVTDTHRAAVFGPDDKPNMHWSSELAQLAVKIPAGRLHDHLRHLIAVPTGRELVFARSMGTPGEHTAVLPDAGWMGMLRTVVGIIDNQRERSISPVLSDQLEQMLLSGLLLTQPNSYSEILASPVPSASPNAVAQAIDLVEADPGGNWTVPRLAQQTGVSVRSLQEGFRRIKGTTPMAFLREVRLEHVHRMLVDPGTRHQSITEIALDTGFTHLGRFAAEYFQRYGVKPSQTRALTR